MRSESASSFENETPSASRAFFRRPGVRLACWFVVLAVFASGIVGGLHRGFNNQPDWRDFVRESQSVWRDRTIQDGTPMFGYLPATFFALWPFTQWMPASVGLVAYVVLHGVAAAGSCYVLYRWWFARAISDEKRSGLERGDFVWPLFLTIAHIQHVLQANQLTLWVLLLCVAGLTLLMHGRDWWGGLALGLGACLKVTPFVFVVYLCLKRRWWALVGMVVAVVAFDLLPSVIVFGPAGAVREHSGWLRRTERYSNRRFIEDSYLRIRRHGHNCSYAIVLARWLRPPPDADYQVILRGAPPEDAIRQARADLAADEYLVLDPVPPPGMAWSKARERIPDVPRFRLAHLSAESVWWIWAATLAFPIACLVIATLRNRARTGSDAWMAEASLWILLMFWPAPMMRDYYLALALPAYVVIWRMVLRSTVGRHRRTVGIAAIVFFYASVLGLAWDDGAYYGLHLATCAGLGAGCVCVWRATARRSGGHDSGAALAGSGSTGGPV